MSIEPAAATRFIDLAFEKMLDHARAARRQLNERPELPEANSVYVLVTHAIGVTRFWLDHVVTGAATDRDREAEFSATGGLDELEEAVGSLRQALPDLVQAACATTTPAVDLSESCPWPWSTDAVVLHVVEELYQHLGHLDLTADLLDL